MITDPVVADLRRELDKARETLTGCETHLARHAEMNAALHCADRVLYSPLHAQVTAAIGQIDHALVRTAPDPRDEPGPAITRQRGQEAPHGPHDPSGDHRSGKAPHGPADRHTAAPAFTTPAMVRAGLAATVAGRTPGNAVRTDPDPVRTRVQPGTNAEDGSGHPAEQRAPGPDATKQLLQRLATAETALARVREAITLDQPQEQQ
ncbi:hypothetical protein [Streptomyces syringium]|uniref:hypothetical protein n=1 Tax=Streptomyces syringium TaxID=76729 RepID=UPI0033C557F4